MEKQYQKTSEGHLSVISSNETIYKLEDLLQIEQNALRSLSEVRYLISRYQELNNK